MKTAFQVNPEYRLIQDAFDEIEQIAFRSIIAESIRSYRRHRHFARSLPRLNVEATTEQYSIKTPTGTIYVSPVVVTKPTIGRRRRHDIRWRASVTFYHPASRWHPEEADDRDLCDAPSILAALFAAIAITDLENITAAISADDEYRSYLKSRGIPLTEEY